MNLSTILSTIPVLLVLACTLQAAENTTISLAKEDVDFVTKAISAGLFEVRSSELAIKRGVLTEEEVTFAKMMISDHTKVNNELEKLAAKKGFTVPSAPLPKQQKLLDDLGKTDDRKLATGYFHDQVNGHEAAIDLFKNASTDCKDPDLRTFAIDKLPTLRAHYEQAKDLYKAH